MAEPSALEQLMLELVNRARLDPIGEIARYNAFAASTGSAQRIASLDDGLPAGTMPPGARQPLAFVSVLETAASNHSKWMIDNDIFAHDQPASADSDGKITATERIFRAGWTDAGQGWRTGENLAYFASTQPGFATQPTTILAQHYGLFYSPGHRTNILQGVFSEVGIGQEFGTFTISGADYSSTSMVTQNYANAGRAFLTGVVFDDADADAFYDIGEGRGDVRVHATGPVTRETTTWGAGGYTLELPAGSYTVTFSGGSLASSVVRTVSVGADNIKIDVDVNASHTPVTTVPLAPVATVPAMPLDNVPMATVIRDGVPLESPMSRYVGPAAGIDWQFLGSDAAREEITGSAQSDFINGLAGDDALFGAAGDDILDGGTGSNFLRGDRGNDIFFTDARNGQVGWSTIVDFIPGVEQVTVWGFRPGVTRVFWENGYGAEGFRGATAFLDMDGSSQTDRSGVDFAVTFSGHTSGSLGPAYELDNLLWFRPQV